MYVEEFDRVFRIVRRSTIKEGVKVFTVDSVTDQFVECKNLKSNCLKREKKRKKVLQDFVINAALHCFYNMKNQREILGGY